MAYGTSIKWCGNVYPGGGAQHDQEKVLQDDEVGTGINKRFVKLETDF